MPKDTKEIGNKKENRRGWIAFFAVIFHFGLIVFSILPETKHTHSITTFSKSYASPIFKQRWAMFAPCPTFENRIKIKYYFDHDTTNWIDPIDELLPMHQIFRFTYHGNIAVGYYNMLFWLKEDIDQLKIDPNKIHDFTQLNKLRNSMGNRLLYNYVWGYSRNLFSRPPVKADLKISYRNVVDNNIKTYEFINYK